MISRNRKILVLTITVMIIALVAMLAFRKTTPVATSGPDKSQANPTREMPETERIVEEYKQTYELPHIKYIRTAIDSYINSGYEGTGQTSNAVEPTTVAGRNCGFKAFDQEYFGGKIIVLNASEFMAGGKIVDILFLDKPDRAFSVIVYPSATGNYDFKSICENPDYSSEYLNRLINEEYFKDLLEEGYYL